MSGREWDIHMFVQSFFVEVCDQLPLLELDMNVEEVDGSLSRLPRRSPGVVWSTIGGRRSTSSLVPLRIMKMSSMYLP